MNLPWRRHGPQRTQGQALVELALVAPVMILLFVFALDFGRVFFGWVGLQNAARIGANYAGSHANAWSGTITPIKAGQQQEFIDQITRDARSINCSLKAIPTPVFSPVGTTAAGDMGSHASVTLQCDFDLITGAFAGAILGDPLTISANSIFPVRNGSVPNLPTPVPSPTPTPTPPPGPTPTPTPTPVPTPTPSPTPTPTPIPCQAPDADFSGTPTTGNRPLTVTFSDLSIPLGCPITIWSWNFGDGTPLSNAQNPAHQYTAKGKYRVTLTVTSAGGSDTLSVNNYIDVN
jgi:hypothetical protein